VFYRRSSAFIGGHLSFFFGDQVRMSERACWIVENYGYRRCPRPAREFRYAVSLHNHSAYSVENLASLNQVVKLWFMRPLKSTLQRAFGLEHVTGLNYNDLKYNPPFSPEDVYRMEAAAVASYGFDGVHLAITDHDEYLGSLELCQRRGDLNGRVAVGEELTVRLDGHVFHLGLSGLDASSAAETHARLQDAARGGRLDELFERLHSSGCLVVFNHPLIPWGPGGENHIPAVELLTRYGWAIHALEYNGMRRREENDRVLELARAWRKPVVGGGDSHLLRPSAALSVSSGANFRDFADEVREGRSVVLVKDEYFAPLGWKLFLRVLYFMANYRRIASFQGQPVAEMLARRWVLLDPIGVASRAFLAVSGGLRLDR
jgi:predicted metal-dependent phosphoesterase TrpH